MRARLSAVVALAAGLHTVVLTTPAFAQSRSGPVQPVPIQPAQPSQTPTPTQPGVSVLPGGDTVVLNNGGTVKGTLVELLPDHVTVQLPNGQLAVIPTKDVHHIERQAAQPGPPAPPGPAQPQPAPPPAGGTVLLHIESPRKVNLMYRPPGGAYDLGCESPCDKMMPLQGDYKLFANGVQPSDEFTLKGNPGDRVVLQVNPGSRGTMIAGWVIFGIGGSVALVGLLVMAVGALVNSTARIGSTSASTSGDSIVATGGIMALVGLAGIGAGLVLAVPNIHTHFEQEVYGRAQASSDDRWMRLPDWREAPRSGAGTPLEAPPLMVPLWGGRF